MVSRQTSIEIFAKLKSDSDNLLCFECRSSDTSYASLSLSVFLCPSCAETHMNLGVDISFVRSLEQETWSIKQLKLLSVGGNRAFREFLATYSIPDDLSIETKYRLVAVQYYRESLLAQGQGLPFTKPPPSLEEGLRLVESDLSEFAPSAPELPQQKSKLGRFFSSAVSMSRSAASKLSIQAQKVKASPTFQAVSSKAKATLSSVGHGLQAGAEWTSEKGKVITEHPKVQATVYTVKSAVSSTVTRVQESSAFQRVSETTSSALGSLGRSVSARFKGKDTA
jgi:hypothetical protein